MCIVVFTASSSWFEIELHITTDRTVTSPKQSLGLINAGDYNTQTQFSYSKDVQL